MTGALVVGLAAPPPTHVIADREADVGIEAQAHRSRHLGGSLLNVGRQTQGHGVALLGLSVASHGRICGGNVVSLCYQPESAATRIPTCFLGVACALLDIGQAHQSEKRSLPPGRANVRARKPDAAARRSLRSERAARPDSARSSEARPTLAGAAPSVARARAYRRLRPRRVSRGGHAPHTPKEARR